MVIASLMSFTLPFSLSTSFFTALPSSDLGRLIDLTVHFYKNIFILLVSSSNLVLISSIPHLHIMMCIHYLVVSSFFSPLLHYCTSRDVCFHFVAFLFIACLNLVSIKHKRSFSISLFIFSCHIADHVMMSKLGDSADCQKWSCVSCFDKKCSQMSLVLVVCENSKRNQALVLLCDVVHRCQVVRMGPNLVKVAAVDALDHVS